MVLNEWYSNLESKIYTILKTKLSRRFSIDCYTTMEENDTETHFPSVLFQELPGLEQAGTLGEADIAAILYTAQIRVTSNVSKNEAKAIMEGVVEVMKGIGFTVTAMPVTAQDGKKYYAIARFRRLIGSGDTDLV